MDTVLQYLQYDVTFSADFLRTFFLMGNNYSLSKQVDFKSLFGDVLCFNHNGLLLKYTKTHSLKYYFIFENMPIIVVRVRTGKKLDAQDPGAAMKVVLIAQLSSESSTTE